MRKRKTKTSQSSDESGEHVMNGTVESRRAELAGLIGKLLAQVWLGREEAKKNDLSERRTM